jgi:hypothetical protein
MAKAMAEEEAKLSGRELPEADEGDADGWIGKTTG